MKKALLRLGFIYLPAAPKRLGLCYYRHWYALKFKAMPCTSAGTELCNLAAGFGSHLLPPVGYLSRMLAVNSALIVRTCLQTCKLIRIHRLVIDHCLRMSSETSNSSSYTLAYHRPRQGKIGPYNIEPIANAASEHIRKPQPR